MITLVRLGYKRGLVSVDVDDGIFNPVVLWDLQSRCTPGWAMGPHPLRFLRRGMNRWEARSLSLTYLFFHLHVNQIFKPIKDEKRLCHHPGGQLIRDSHIGTPTVGLPCGLMCLGGMGVSLGDQCECQRCSLPQLGERGPLEGVRLRRYPTVGKRLLGKCLMIRVAPAIITIISGEIGVAPRARCESKIWLVSKTIKKQTELD